MTNVQDHHIGDMSVVEHGDSGQELEAQMGVKLLEVLVEDPIIQRVRIPNSKYDQAVDDLDSVEVKGIQLSGMCNCWRGVSWPQ